MNESEGYVVYLFPQALEALGEAIKPYLRDGPGGKHVLCHEIDTGGSLVEMTLQANTPDGRAVELELMVPLQMVQMVVSARSDAEFGFGPRVSPMIVQPVAGSAPAVASTDVAPSAQAQGPQDSPAVAQAKLPPEG